MVTMKSGGKLIVRNTRVQGGEPTVRGTRVPVCSIVLSFARHGDVDRVAAAYRLEPTSVPAALAYYDAHKAEIDRIIDQHERAADG